MADKNIITKALEWLNTPTTREGSNSMLEAYLEVHHGSDAPRLPNYAEGEEGPDAVDAHNFHRDQD